MKLFKGKKALVLVLSIIMVFGLVGCGDSKSSETVKCTVSIACENLVKDQAGVKEEVLKIVPKDGVVLKETEVEVNKGETIFDATEKVCKDNKIPFSYQGSPDTHTEFIDGIANIFIKDAGKTSGWVYKINDKMGEKATSEVKISKGDKIVWGYVKSYKDTI
ncbi:MAG: DUF4430 domain-containing protein [Anaerovoracaceae bacterium]